MSGPCTLARRSAAALCLLTAFCAAGARAERFDEHDLRGNYAFAFDGTFNGNPAAAVGRFHADGNGHLLAGARTLSLGAAVPFQQTFTCDYVVNADGTGTADCLTVPGILVPAGDEESFAFVLLNHGRRAYFIATTPGAVLRGTTERH